MAKRKIIKIDEAKCTGCALCIPNCPEGAMQIIDGKARLISDLFCDGLGACIGHCPEGAITIEERDARGYDERKVMENIVRQGENTIKAHLKHLKEHNQGEYLKEALNFLKERKIAVPLSEEAASSCGQFRAPALEAASDRRPVSSDAHFAHTSSGCPGSKVMHLKGNHKAKKRLMR